MFFVGNIRPLWAGHNGVLAQSAQAYDNEHQQTSMKINPCPHGHLDILQEACILCGDGSNFQLPTFIEHCKPHVGNKHDGRQECNR
jgi:hypothetical protein